MIRVENMGNILHIRASGRLTDQDYRDVLIPAFEAFIQRQGKARAVFHMDEKFEGWELEAAWDDAKFGVAHRNDFEKIAVVGGPKWVDWCAKLFAMFTTCKLRTFGPHEVEVAWDWVSE